MSVREDFAEILKLVRPGARVLDIGCEDGALLELLTREGGRHLVRPIPQRAAVVRCHGAERAPARCIIALPPAGLPDHPSDLGPDPGAVMGDPTRLQQVVWNLLSNALKFTPEHGRVTLELSATDSTLSLQVKDTGAGINPAFLPFVFDRFRQEDAATTRAHGGLGLGLSIVRHLVELHGGHVTAESDGEGRGATFAVHLPLVTSPTLAKEYAAAATTALDDLPSLDGVHVLLVEDEQDARTLTATLLERQGARVTAAANAREALAALEREVPDVLLSDIAMPETDGYALIRLVRQNERWAGVPAAALTAFVSPTDRGKALLAGFDTHVPKPVEPSELMAVVAALADRRSAATLRKRAFSSAQRSTLT